MGHYFRIDGKQLQEQYKDHISTFHQWEQKGHAAEWMLFPSNMGEYLSIDETALSGGELYTIVTNKAAKGGKGSIVAMLKGTQAEQIIAVLERIAFRLRNKVKEVTLDMAANMAKAIRRCFPSARRGIDQFAYVKPLLYQVQPQTLQAYPRKPLLPFPAWSVTCLLSKAIVFRLYNNRSHNARTNRHCRGSP